MGVRVVSKPETFGVLSKYTFTNVRNFSTVSIERRHYGYAVAYQNSRVKYAVVATDLLLENKALPTAKKIYSLLKKEVLQSDGVSAHTVLAKYIEQSLDTAPRLISSGEVRKQITMKLGGRIIPLVIIKESKDVVYQ